MPFPEPHASVVMLDLDGTLVDTMDALAALAADVLHDMHGMRDDEARSLYAETSGVPFREQLDLILPGVSGLERAAEVFETRKISIARGATLPEARLRALERLRAMGYRLAVSSSSAHHLVEEFHQRIPFGFDLVLGFRQGQSKGARHFELACQALDARLEEIVFVGDSLTDARLAAAAGVSFIGRVGTFTHDRFAAEFPGVELIGDVVELPNRLPDGNR